MLLTGKIEKAYKVRSYSCLLERRNSRQFLKLGDWRANKIRACLFFNYETSVLLVDLFTDAAEFSPIADMHGLKFGLFF